MTFGTCDCCDKPNRMLFLSHACGLEAYACHECRGNDPHDYDEAGELALEIDRLRPKAESGAQWAHICALEARMVELRA